MKKFLTKFVAMNPSHCVGCWKCVEACPKKAIGKVGFLWHKHAVFCDADACVGCKKCVKTCPHGVFFVPDADFKVPNVWQRVRSKISVESLLPLFLLLSVVTGFRLHVVGHNMENGVNHKWLVMHLVSSLLMVVLSIVHVSKHK